MGTDMNYDELAFFNRQLALMLREGIPLEGALKQLSAGMSTGHLKAEIQTLEADLSRGTPLPQALTRRQLPELFRRLLELGARSNDLPGVLTLLADHYERANTLWTRLKGLLTYPVIVILVSLALTLILSLIFRRFLSGFFTDVGSVTAVTEVGMWMPPILLGAIAAVMIASLSIPSWRSRLRWRLPPFREASLAQLASAMSLMLRNGTPLPEALAMAESLESGTPAAATLSRWRSMLQAGRGAPVQWVGPHPPFPPLFLWLVQSTGEDVAGGFAKAAEIYEGRASYRIELALYGLLPISVLLLGQMVFWQIAPLMQALIKLMNMLGTP
jgi:type IV pilus assembly protein PilC